MMLLPAVQSTPKETDSNRVQPPDVSTNQPTAQRIYSPRRVSYIIYLTDPDSPWAAADGGSLELYPLVDGAPHTPDVAPTTSHLPVWNSMAMFVVQPGRSFHSVQEVRRFM
jgi:Rps23 Pro-64 3,4-dihydroxylase Tpa1-like proline 4-hydroxylase